MENYASAIIIIILAEIILFKRNGSLNLVLLVIYQKKTGATLMYLAGIDIFAIMKVTGHTTPEMLKRYIKADQLDVVQKLTDKYDYFD